MSLMSYEQAMGKLKFYVDNGITPRVEQLCEIVQGARATPAKYVTLGATN